jgi:hypothetical protein
MSMQVTLTLPDGLWKRAEAWAHCTGQDVVELLTETIELSLEPLGGADQGDSLENLPDSTVLKAVETQMPAAEDRRLSQLLDGQQARSLSVDERAGLRALMQIYQQGLLRKAWALREAVRRGLREPLES